MLVLALLAIAACGNGNRGGDAGVDLGVPDLASACPNDLPAACPSPTPSWDGGVSQIIASKCIPCHMPGGLAFDNPLTDYNSVYQRRGIVLDQVYSCYMPPPDAAQLDASERQALLGWMVCGAPNN